MIIVTRSVNLFGNMLVVIDFIQVQAVKMLTIAHAHIEIKQKWLQHRQITKLAESVG